MIRTILIKYSNKSYTRGKYQPPIFFKDRDPQNYFWEDGTPQNKYRMYHIDQIKKLYREGKVEIK